MDLLKTEGIPKSAASKTELEYAVICKLHCWKQSLIFVDAR